MQERMRALEEGQFAALGGPAAPCCKAERPCCPASSLGLGHRELWAWRSRAPRLWQQTEPPRRRSVGPEPVVAARFPVEPGLRNGALRKATRALARIVDLDRPLLVTGDLVGNLISGVLIVGLLACVATLFYVAGLVFANAYVLIESNGILVT